MHLNLNSLAFLVVILTQNVLTFDLFEGYDFGARMSYKEIKKHGLLFFLREETVEFEYPPGTNITGIAIEDISEDKHGVPTILEGGIGQSYVKIHVESERSRGLKFLVEIYTTNFKMDLPALSENVVIEDNKIPEK